MCERRKKQTLIMLPNSVEATWLFVNDCSKAVPLMWFCMLVSVSVVLPPFLFADTIKFNHITHAYACVICSNSTILLRG